MQSPQLWRPQRPRTEPGSTSPPASLPGRCPLLSSCGGRQWGFRVRSGGLWLSHLLLASSVPRTPHLISFSSGLFILFNFWIFFLKKIYLLILFFDVSGSLLALGFSIVATWVKVAWSCLTFCDPMDYTIHGILQARILEWVAFPFSRGSSQPRDGTQASRTAGGFFTSWAPREAHWELLTYQKGCLLKYAVTSDWYKSSVRAARKQQIRVRKSISVLSGCLKYCN